MHTYEIRTCVKNRWTMVSRCSDKNEALSTGKVMAGDRSLDSVKVIEERYDEATGLFREKVIFSYFNQKWKVACSAAAKAAAARRTPAPKVPPRRMGSFSGQKQPWLVVLALILSLGGNFALATLLGGGWSGNFQVAKMEKIEPTGGKGNGLIIYDLPAVTMSYGAQGNTRSVKVRLGLALNKRSHIPDIENHLSKIIASVANGLSAVSEMDLNKRQGLNKLRRSLHAGVQTAAGQTPVEGVLFKEIIVF